MADAKIGTLSIDKAYIGSDEVQKMYLGETEVWSAAVPGVTVNFTVEGNATSAGIAYKTPTMADFNTSTMFTPYSDTITGSFAIADTSITVGGFKKYGWGNNVPLDTLTYSINGGAAVDISSAKYSTPETISLNVGDTITFYGYGED